MMPGRARWLVQLQKVLGIARPVHGKAFGMELSNQQIFRAAEINNYPIWKGGWGAVPVTEGETRSKVGIEISGVEPLRVY